MKHPILSNRVRLIVWWLVWLFLALGQSLLFYFAYGSFINISIIDSLVSLLIYSGIALSLWYPFRFFNSRRNPDNSPDFQSCCKWSTFCHPLGPDNKVYNDNCLAGTKQLPGILGCNFPLQGRNRCIYLRTNYSDLLSFCKPE